jgi:thiamine-phosphate pyrophosphorylase
VRGRRPLPRVHAVTDPAVLHLPDLGVRAAALASGGSAVALHARDRAAPTNILAAVAARFMALASPPEAAVFVSARPDVAAAVRAHGVQLSATDLAPADARRLLPEGWIGRSVHRVEEARAAMDEGADYLIAGPVYPTATHPGHPGFGPALITACAAVGPPVLAIGGITADRLDQLRDAGAYGVAAIRGLWLSDEPARTVAEWLQALG